MSAEAKELPSANDQWRQFEGGVVPKNASAIQRREMKRAFFAGFTSCLRSGQELAEMSEDDAVARLGRFHEEVKGFAVAVEMGAA